jgi:hypothetical protein
LARDTQDRPALQRLVNEAAAAAARAPKDAAAQFRMALASSYLAEVEIEMHDKKAAQQAAVRGIQAAEQAIALKPDDAENYRVLATLCGQAITDMLSGFNYGPRAKDAVNKAVSLAPKSSPVWVARGVGNYYLPAQLGGGAPRPSPISTRPSISTRATPKPGSGSPSPCASRIRMPKRGRRSAKRWRSIRTASGCASNSIRPRQMTRLG